MIVVGLTGKIGSGKSTTLKIIKNLGYNVFDCDEVSRVLLNRQEIKNEIILKFNNVKNKFITSNTINSKKLGNYVFSNSKELEKLEKILHPKIKKKERDFIYTSKLNRNKIVFVDIPLLFRDKNHLRFDYIFYVHVNTKIQSIRVLKRSSMDAKKFKNILNKQKFEQLKYNKYISLKINTGNGLISVRKKIINFIKKKKILDKKQVWPILYNYYNKF